MGEEGEGIQTDRLGSWKPVSASGWAGREELGSFSKVNGTTEQPQGQGKHVRLQGLEQLNLCLGEVSWVEQQSL